MPKSHCGRRGVTLGPCNSIEAIISEMVWCITTLALPVRLSTEPRQVLNPSQSGVNWVRLVEGLLGVAASLETSSEKPAAL